MIAETRDALAAAGCAADRIVLEFGADLRYAGQQHEIAVKLPEDPRHHRDSTVIAAAFEAAYRAHYGLNPSHVEIEVVNWRLVAKGPVIEDATSAIPEGQGAPPGKRRVYLWPDAAVPVYSRDALKIGQVIQGPALVEERETTVVIPPAWQASVDRIGCIVATEI
jgi:N-methylhydantoinase A